MLDYDTCQEEVLVKKAGKKDAHAFAVLYERVYKDLYRFALYTMRNPQDAEDAVSEAVISAYENIAKLRKAEAFRSWIFRILVNVCKKKFSKESIRTLELVETDLVTETDDGEAQDVREAFRQLEEEERLILSLSIFAGYNSKEIGKMLGINANTVRSKRSRALGKMEQKLGV